MAARPPGGLFIHDLQTRAIIFPEEFSLFFSGNQRARKVFDQLHSNIYEPAFWRGLQDRIRSGHIEDFFPYRRELRFKRDLPVRAAIA